MQHWHDEYIMPPWVGFGLGAPGVYYVSWLTVLTAVATVLALSLKHIVAVGLLSWPGGVFLFYAMEELVRLVGFTNEIPVLVVTGVSILGMIIGPVYFGAAEDENKLHTIYQKALHAMAVLSALVLLVMLWFSSMVHP